MRASSRTKPSTSIVSCRQSCSVWFTSGWSGISRSPTRFSPHASLVREHHRQQVLRIGTLELRRHLAAAVHAPHRQRRRGVPAPAGAEHRRVQQRLHQHVARAGRLQVVLHLVQREAVRRTQRQHDAVFQRAGLQLEIELAAHALAQRQAPGLVDARAVGRMDHQVRVAHLVEEALEHDPRSAGQHAERGLRSGRGTARAAAPPLAAGASHRAASARRPPRRRPVACRRVSQTRDTASHSSSVRPRLSPSQNGIVGG